MGLRECPCPGEELTTTALVSALPWQCFTIEKLGRRPLIITGFCAMGICSAGITVSLLLQVESGTATPGATGMAGAGALGALTRAG